ncbi:MAG: histidinol-phosphate aminotransferase [Planctomycetes bacterium DG_23]|nr:MAG: histidinol-phosphate aminotransferase [Planctomycetes bacterium DG_23]
MPYLRKNIARMKGYEPGEQPRETDFIKLNTNENPYPPSPKVLRAIKNAASQDLRLYPDPLATEVREKAAKVYGLRQDLILVGRGSDELLTIAFRSLVAEGDTVIYPYPSYLLYETQGQIQMGRLIKVQFNRDWSLPRDFARAGARLVLLANPNSPSGTLLSRQEIERVTKKARGVVLVDEAYADFAASKAPYGEESALPLVKRYDNLIVLRSLSKSFSLAGMRIGFAAGDKALISGMLKVKDSYNVDRLSIKAAVAALSDLKHMRRNVGRVQKTRERLSRSLLDLGAEVCPSKANFVLARFERRRGFPPARKIYQTLKRKKILVRYMDLPRLRNSLRITVGTDREIATFLKELRAILRRKRV